MPSRRALLRALPAAALLRAGAARAQAAWPARPVQVIVPYAPGGGADVVTRLLLSQAAADPAAPRFVIENRPGAGGNIGAEALARTAPDGYTIGTVTIGTHGANPFLFRRAAFDPVADFTPIGLISLQPVVIAVREDSPLRSLEALVAPGGPERTYGSSGNGTSGHLAAELLRARTGCNLAHVPYRGSGPAWADLLGGRVELVVDNVQVALPHQQAGRVRVLGVSAEAPMPVLPGVPAIAAAVPGYVVNSWNGLAGPARLPTEIRDRLAAMVGAWLRGAELEARYRELGIAVPPDPSPGFLTGFIHRELELWGGLIRATGIRAE